MEKLFICLLWSLPTRLEPPNLRLSSPAVLTLRKLAHRLFICLPRLIVSVRALRSRPGSDFAYAATLGKSLLSLVDNDAENELLHLVSVLKTQHPADAYITPVFFKFKTSSDFEAAVYYWQTQLLLTRLCSTIQWTLPDDEKFDLASMTAEGARLSTNLLMSWEYAHALGAFGTRGGGYGTMSFVLGNIAVWGYLTDVDTFRDLPSAKARVWVRQRVEVLIGGVKTVSERDMNEMAELLVGGPLVGRIPQMVAS